MTDSNEPRRTGGNGCLIAALLGGVLLVVAGVGLDSIERSPAPAPIVEREPEPEPEPPAIESEPASSSIAPAFDPTSEPLPILFAAEALGSSNVAAGTRCTLALFVARGRNEIVARSAELRCAGSEARRGAVEQATLTEVPLGDGWYAYRASFRAGTSADGLVVDSAERDLWTRAGDSFVLDDLSVPRRWAPFLDANAALVASVQHRLVRLAVPVSVDGDTPPEIVEAMRAAPTGEPATRCELIGDAVTLDEAVDCRLLVRCGSTILYGAGTTGYIDCAVRDGHITSGDDTGESPADSDPRVHLDADAGVLTISDATADGSWSARFRLEEDPLCTIAGTWRGSALDTEGRELSFVLDGTGGIEPWRAGIRWTGGALDGVSETVTVTPDCASGELDFATNISSPSVSAASYRLRLGAGMRSMAGARSAPGASLVMWAVRD